MLEQAERDGDVAEMVICLKTIGRAQVDLARVDDGIATLERALALALGANENRLASQVFANLGAGCVDAFRLAQAEAWLRKGIDFCTERDLDATRLFQTAWLAHALLPQGRWDEAAAAAHAVIAEPKATVIARIAALVALGRLRARRGDPGVWSALDEARDLAAGAGAGRFHVARAEAAWLEGRDGDAARDAAAQLPQAVAERQIAFAAQLSLWCRLGGDEATPIPDFCARAPVRPRSRGPLEGRGRRVARARLPVRDRARPGARRRAGATPGARHVRGARRAADGRAGPPSTACGGRARLAARPAAFDARTPCGLTDKEVAVLELLAAGLRNKEIALRLHRSARTVDHHLAAIFVKLGVATRAEAVSAAYRLGVVAASSASA